MSGGVAVGVCMCMCVGMCGGGVGMGGCVVYFVWSFKNLIENYPGKAIPDLILWSHNNNILLIPTIHSRILYSSSHEFTLIQ